MSQISRGGHRPPALMNVYVYTYIFDVMKIVYSILHAMRAIVCNAHEGENTVLHYILIPTQKNRLYAICTACCFMAFLCRNRMFRHNFDLSFHTLDIAKHRFELKSVQNSAFDNYSLSSILCWQDLNFRISDTAILYLLSFFRGFLL